MGWGRLGGLASPARFQPFINYNFNEGWYLSFSSIITGTEADVMNAQVAPYYNVVSPDFGPEWTIRFQLTFVFPQ